MFRRDVGVLQQVYFNKEKLDEGSLMPWKKSAQRNPVVNNSIHPRKSVKALNLKRRRAREDGDVA